MAIILDIETYTHPCATEFLEKPNLDAIEPAGNLKDPVKIAASIAERKQAAVEAYNASLGRAALDWNLSRIVCLGAHFPDCPEPSVHLCQTEHEEAHVLGWFWTGVQKHQDVLVGYCARTFDLPVLIRRSQLLGVVYPKLNLAPFGRSHDILDLYDELTFHSNHGTSLMPRTLKNFARRFGIPVPDQTDGKDVAAMVAAGDWEGVRSHCLSDIDLTRELAIRIGLVKPWRTVVA